MSRLEDKVAVITGAGSGIGRALAKRFVAADAFAVGQPEDIANVALFLASDEPAW